MLMIRPPARARMCGTTARDRRTTLMSTESIASRQSSSVNEVNGPDFGPPVLVTRMSMAPSCAAESLTRRSQSAALATSATTGTTVAPVAAAISAAVARSTSSEREQMATRAPSRARDSAVARPSPLLAAQTMAHRPSR